LYSLVESVGSFYGNNFMRCGSYAFWNKITKTKRQKRRKNISSYLNVRGRLKIDPHKSIHHKKDTAKITYISHQW